MGSAELRTAVRIAASDQIVSVLRVSTVSAAASGLLGWKASAAVQHEATHREVVHRGVVHRALEAVVGRVVETRGADLVVRLADFGGLASAASPAVDRGVIVDKLEV